MQLLSGRHPSIQDIVIGFKRDEEDMRTAALLKELWETHGCYHGEGGTVLDIVSWNDNSSSFKKYYERIKRHAPDAIVVIGRSNGCEEILRRQNRFQERESKVYVLDDKPCDMTLYYEGLTGVDKQGRAWQIEYVS